MLIAHGDYDIFGRILYNGKCGKWTSLGKIRVPTDFVDKAKIPNDVQVIIEQGGFAVYAELHQGKVRTKFYGNPSDNEIRRCYRARARLKNQSNKRRERLSGRHRHTFRFRTLRSNVFLFAKFKRTN